MPNLEFISSHSNPLLVQLRRLQQDGAAYRRHGVVWVEGEHLCEAALLRGVAVQRVLLNEPAAASQALLGLAARARQADHTPAPVMVVQQKLFAEVSALETPATVGFVLASPQKPALQADVATVVLDRLQDAGNVGSILRSAAAFGVRQVLALKGTVALWSPKVLRAGQGAHFALSLIEGCGETELDALDVPLVTTSSHLGADLPRAALPHPCAWVLGHEGQGVSPDLAARCALQVRIPQPGGEESLNVAAAAAVCLYESMRRLA
jgi:RNA methyltransferase, TrmH family